MHVGGFVRIEKCAEVRMLSIVNCERIVRYARSFKRPQNRHEDSRATIEVLGDSNIGVSSIH